MVLERTKSIMKVLRMIFVLCILISIPLTVYIVIRREEALPEGEAEGADVVVNIYPNQENYTIQKNIFGANLPISRVGNLYHNNRSLYDSEFKEALRDTITVIRYPNGCEIAKYDYKNPAHPYLSVDEILQLAEDANVDIVFEMPVHGFLPENIRNYEYKPCGWDDNIPRYNRDDIVDFVNRYTVTPKNQGKKYIGYYELGNEEWGDQSPQLGGPLSPEQYIQAAREVSGIIKSIAPYVKVFGISSVRYDGGEPYVWGAEEYKKYPESFDKITYHQYWREGYTPDLPEGESLFAVDFNIKDKTLKLYRTTFPDIPKFRRPAITEWNLTCWGQPPWKHRNAGKYEQALYTISLLSLFVEEGINFTNFHTYLADGACAVVKMDLTKHPTYYAFQIFKSHFGGIHTKIEILSPKVSVSGYGEYDAVVGTSSKVGDKIYIVLVNRSSGNYPTSQGIEYLKTQINIKNYSENVRFNLYELSASEYSSTYGAITFIKKEDNKEAQNGFSIIIPKHSAVVLEIEKVQESCQPSCTGKQCGDENGCGGTCTDCPSGYTCNLDEGKCVNTSQSPCTVADIHGRNGEDDKVTGWDVAMVAANWKESNFNPVADIYGPKSNNYKKDGKVDGYDLSKILACWGDV